jgi:hypothetical protein
MGGLDEKGMIKPCPYDKENTGRCCKPIWVKEKCSCYLLPKNRSRNSILYL